MSSRTQSPGVTTPGSDTAANALTQKQRAIVRVARDDPEKTNREIADQTDASPSYVGQVRDKHVDSQKRAREQDGETFLLAFKSSVLALLVYTFVALLVYGVYIG
mgnify:CR=1 FL=1